jgi:hypothetical protein
MRQHQFAQVALMGRRPCAFTLVSVTVPQKKRFQPMPRPTPVIDCVGAGAAQIADGFIGRLGNVDRGQFARA